jgi:hypothetical protein
MGGGWEGWEGAGIGVWEGRGRGGVGGGVTGWKGYWCLPPLMRAIRLALA